MLLLEATVCMELEGYKAEVFAWVATLWHCFGRVVFLDNSSTDGVG